MVIQALAFILVIDNIIMVINKLVLIMDMTYRIVKNEEKILRIKKISNKN